MRNDDIGNLSRLTLHATTWIATAPKCPKSHGGDDVASLSRQSSKNYIRMPDVQTEAQTRSLLSPTSYWTRRFSSFVPKKLTPRYLSIPPFRRRYGSREEGCPRFGHYLWLGPMCSRSGAILVNLIYASRPVGAL